MSNMKIALIQPRTVSAELDFRYRGEHLGLSSLTAVLQKSGYDAIQLDDALDKRDLNQTLDILSDLNPNFVGVTVPAQQAAGTTVSYVNAIRERFHNVYICIGGIFASIAHREFFNRVPAIDFVLRGEGEESLIELIRCLENAADLSSVDGLSFRNVNGECVANKEKSILWNLDALPNIDRSTMKPLLAENRRVSLFSGRGCYGECTFCSLHAFWGENLVRLRSPEIVVNEIDELYDAGVRKLRFINDIFLDKSASSAVWLNEFERLLQNRNYNLNMWMQFRAQDVDVITLKRLKRLGLKKVLIGVESGNQSILDLMNKHTTVHQNEVAVQQAIEAGISEVAIGFIMFHPDSTLISLKDNLEFLSRMPTFRYKNLFSHAYAYQGTRLADYIRSEGLFIPGENWYDIGGYRFRHYTTQQIWDKIEQLKYSFGKMIWLESAIDIEERFIKGRQRKIAILQADEINKLFSMVRDYRRQLSNEMLYRFKEIINQTEELKAAISVPDSLNLLAKNLETELFRLQAECDLPVGYHLNESSISEFLG